jgi:hypothetical protein
VRRVLAFVFFSIVLTPVVAYAPATAQTNGCYRTLFGTAIDCSGSSLTPLSGSSQPQSSAQSRYPGPQANPTPAVAALAAPIPVLESGANGNLCLSHTTDPNATTPADYKYLVILIKNFQVNYAACVPAPGTPAAPQVAALAVPPSVLAVNFWDTIPLPVPKPSIPPGYAITGKPAYLVTDGTVAPAPFTTETPLGLLSVSARGAYTVEWGDGVVSGPFSSEGLAYPDGNISHTYDNVGTVTVTVDETWTATWTLGGASGTLDQLETRATIPGFPVRQLQAVLIG